MEAFPRFQDYINYISIDTFFLNNNLLIFVLKID